MRYGAMNFPIKPILDEIESVAALGFDYLELAMDPPMAHYTIIREQQNKILKALSRHGLGLVCHLPTFVYTADLTESIRQASLDELLNALGVASEMNAAKVVLHPSVITGLGIFVKELALKYAHEALALVAASADQLDLCLCLENMFPRCGFLCAPDEFEAVLQRYPKMKLTLDTAHANIGTKGENRSLEFIQRYADRLGHLHLSDNKGKRDDHLPMGQGSSDFRSIIQALYHSGYDDTLTLEIFVDDRSSLVAGRNRIQDMLLEFKGA